MKIINKLYTFNFLAAAVVFSFWLQGCSYITATKIPTGSNEYEGFPYYMKKPILVVSNDTIKIMCINDPSNVWGIKVGAVLAKNKTKMEFGGVGSDGCDNTIKIDTDLEDDAIALKLLDTAGTALGEAMKAGLLGNQLTNAGQTGKFQVFDIVFNKETEKMELSPLISQEMFNNSMITVPTMKEAVMPVGDATPSPIDINPNENTKKLNATPPSVKNK